MIKSWQLQEAKNKFSQVVNDAEMIGPQVITRRGVEVAIVLSMTEYQQLIATQPKLSAFFQHSPLAEAALDWERDQSDVREELGW